MTPGRKGRLSPLLCSRYPVQSRCGLSMHLEVTLGRLLRHRYVFHSHSPPLVHALARWKSLRMDSLCISMSLDTVSRCAPVRSEVTRG